MLLLGLYPVEDAASAGRGSLSRRQAPGAREAIDGEIDVGEALGWRDFMVSDWDDAGQVAWLDENRIELLRGHGIAGPGRVSVDGREYETERIVVATGSAPAFPPIEGLDRLEGVWTNREATSVKELPSSL